MQTYCDVKETRFDRVQERAEATAETAMPEIVVKLGGRTLQKIILTGYPRVTIGRTPENTVVLDNMGVSRHHATIDFFGGKPLLTDNQSMNGTFLNARKITTQELQDGDVIDIGKFTLQYLENDAQKTPGEEVSGTMFLDTCKQRELINQNKSTSQALVQASTFRLVSEGSINQQDFYLDAAVTTMGKSPGAGIQVKGFFIAPFQAQIVLENGAYYLMNIGRRRTTFLNGNKVVARVRLRLEDRIQVGRSLFRFTAG
jgi:pSer/pThr/pTyr-binding forkhead associated (FHA) protein